MNKTLKNPLKLENLEKTEGIKLSLFMPTHLADPENRQDPIVFKNLLKEAEEQLKEYPQGTLADVMDSLNQMQQDQMFWNYSKKGLGILASAEETKVFQVGYTVPKSVKIGSTYHILPLLRHMEGKDEAILADLSRDRIDLYHFDGAEVNEIEPEGLEMMFSDLFSDKDPGADGQAGTTVRGSSTTYHAGITKPEEDRKERKKYFRYLDGEFENIYKERRLPFVLAGTTETVSAFLELAKGTFYLKETIDKPLDSFDPNELRELADTIMKAHRREGFHSDQDVVSRALSQNLAETDLAKIKKLTEEGRVGELLVNEDYINKDSQELDELIRDLYLNGAVIKPMVFEDKKRTEPYLAILRY